MKMVANLVEHLGREMDLNGLQADEPFFKTQMTVTKQKTKHQQTQQKTKRNNQKTNAEDST